MTRSGDLAELTELGEAHPLRPHDQLHARELLGHALPRYARWQVFEARRAALEADIVVVNHHLLLADLALKEDGFGDLLPSVDAVILDEAHQLPDLASEFFGVALSSRQIEVLAADLRTELRVQGCEDDSALQLVAPLERAAAACVAALGRSERHLAWRQLPPFAGAALEELADALAACGEGLRALTGSPSIDAMCRARRRGLRGADHPAR